MAGRIEGIQCSVDEAAMCTQKSTTMVKINLSFWAKYAAQCNMGILKDLESIFSNVVEVVDGDPSLGSDKQLASLQEVLPHSQIGGSSAFITCLRPCQRLLIS